MSPKSPFLEEWISSRSPARFLPISTSCNCDCIFCTKKFNPFPAPRDMFRDIEDIKLQLTMMDDHELSVNMTSILPGRLSEGEAFLHPRFFQVLSLVRKKYPFNDLIFNSNCSDVDEHFLRDLSRYNPVIINVSLHSTKPDVWSSIFKRSEHHAEKALKAITLFDQYRFTLWGSIVTLPRLCGGWIGIEETVRFLASKGAKKVFLHYPGYTDLTPPDTVEKIECDMIEFTDFAYKMKSQNKIDIFPFPDLKTPLKIPLNKIITQTLRGNLKNKCGPYQNVLWLVSAAAYDRLRVIVEKSGPHANHHFLFPTKNSSFGGNVFVGGLLTVDDFIASGRQALAKYPATDLILIPDTPFDGLRRDLFYKPAYKIVEELNRNVWLIRGDGSFDPLLKPAFYAKRGNILGDLEETITLFYGFLKEESRLEESFNLIDTFPIDSTWGFLKQEEFKEIIMREFKKKHLHLVSRYFYLLDTHLAVCREQWQTNEDPSALFNRWTSFFRRDSKWKIEWIRQSEDRGELKTMEAIDIQN